MKVDSISEFIKEFKNADNIGKWELVIKNQHLDFSVEVNMYQVIIRFKEFKEEIKSDFLHFHLASEDGLFELLSYLKIKCEWT
mgnify:CR=1 FL=1